MKRVNIKRDVDSRIRIGSAQQAYVPQITEVEPQNEQQEDVQSQEDRVTESDQSGIHEKPQKRGRTPKGDAEEIPVRTD